MTFTPPSEVIEQRVHFKEKQLPTQSSDGEENIAEEIEASHIFTESLVLGSKQVEEKKDLNCTSESKQI